MESCMSELVQHQMARGMTRQDGVVNSYFLKGKQQPSAWMHLRIMQVVGWILVLDSGADSQFEKGSSHDPARDSHPVTYRCE